MKKSSYTAMVLGTAGGVFFALGMCMCLLPEWNLFMYGVISGAIGLVLLLAALLVWRRMSGKAPMQISKKAVQTVLSGTVSALMIGTGMCLVMVWSQLFFGIIVGLAGIFLLITFVPLIRGLN